MEITNPQDTITWAQRVFKDYSSSDIGDIINFTRQMDIFFEAESRIGFVEYKFEHYTTDENGASEWLPLMSLCIADEAHVDVWN